MANDMLTPEELIGFPGAPYGAAAVDAAVGALRAECEWHISPTRVDTWTLRTGGSDTLVLPTLHIQKILAVEAPLAVYAGTWWAAVRDLSDGVLLMPGGWPAIVTITVQHGWEDCPPELKALVADRARTTTGGGRVRSESIGGRSVTLESGAADASADAVLSKYMLGGRV